MIDSRNREKCLRFYDKVLERINNQNGASLMAALLFFVLCAVGASILLASTTASAGKIDRLSREDQKRYAVSSAAEFLRDELTKTENTVKIKEVIVEDSRKEDMEDNFYCYYVGNGKNQNNESTWQKFYDSASSETSGGTWTSGTDSAVLDSMIVDIYRENEYQDQAGDVSGSDGDDELSDDDFESSDIKDSNFKDFTLSVKKSGSGTDTEFSPLKVDVRLYMADNYKITAIVSDTVTSDKKKEERQERRLELDALTSKNRSVVVETFDDENEDAGEDNDEDDSYTITTTTIITTIKWQNGTIEKELEVIQ